MKSICRKVKKILKNPISIVPALGMRGRLKWLGDTTYLKLCYKSRFGEKLNLINPKTYNEKLQWLKLNYRNSNYTDLVDKYIVKDIVSNNIGAQYIVPLIGVYDSFDDINFGVLPNKFVLKLNHNSSGVFICKNKLAEVYVTKEGDTITYQQVKHIVTRMIKENYYFNAREWPYKNVIPKIIVESYLEGEFSDYKVFCFNGEAKIICIESNNNEEKTCDFYDKDFKRLDIMQVYDQSNCTIRKPSFLKELLSLAEKLSKSIPTVRIDFFEVDGKIYFAEYTFYNWAGLVPFKPSSWDDIFGKWVVLPQKKT